MNRGSTSFNIEFGRSGVEMHSMTLDREAGWLANRALERDATKMEQRANLPRNTGEIPRAVREDYHREFSNRKLERSSTISRVPPLLNGRERAVAPTERTARRRKRRLPH